MYVEHKRAESPIRSFRHYLQSDSWLNLRTQFQKVDGVFYQFAEETGRLLVAHLPFERSKRFSMRKKTLEIFFGPTFEAPSFIPRLDTGIFKEIVQIAHLYGAKKIRIHGYMFMDYGYVTLNEYIEILERECIHFTSHLSTTLIYELEKHDYNKLSRCDASVRKNLRKANDVVIVIAKTPGQIQDFLVQHALIKGIRAPKANEIRAYQDWQDGCILLLAYNPIDNRCLGTLGFTYDGYLATEIASSTRKGPEARGVQEKLHLIAFDEAKSLGLKKFDLAGLQRESNGEWNSIAKFKMKFGGEFIETGFIEIDMRKAESSKIKN